MKIRTLVNRQFLVYITGGLISAAIDVGVLQLLIAMGIGPLLAATIGFFVGLFFNFVFHVHLTFKSTMSLRAFIHYLVVVGFNYLITILFIYISFSVLQQGVLPGKILSFPVIAASGYFFGKFWIFK